MQRGCRWLCYARRDAYPEAISAPPPSFNPRRTRCKFIINNNITLVPGSFQETGSWVWRISITRTPGISSVITLPSASSFRLVPQIWPDPSCNLSSAELNTMGPVAMPWTLFRTLKPAAYRRHYATSSRVSKPSIHTTHIIIFHRRLNDENAMQICHCACNTDNDPACCLQRQMALNFPSRGMHLPVVFGSVSPIMRSVHTPWSQLCTVQLTPFELLGTTCRCILKLTGTSSIR